MLSARLSMLRRYTPGPSVPLVTRVSVPGAVKVPEYGGGVAPGSGTMLVPPNRNVEVETTGSVLVALTETFRVKWTAVFKVKVHWSRASAVAAVPKTTRGLRTALPLAGIVNPDGPGADVSCDEAELDPHVGPPGSVREITSEVGVGVLKLLCPEGPPSRPQ